MFWDEDRIICKWRIAACCSKCYNSYVATGVNGRMQTNKMPWSRYYCSCTINITTINTSHLVSIVKRECSIFSNSSSSFRYAEMLKCHTNTHIVHASKTYNAVTSEWRKAYTDRRKNYLQQVLSFLKWADLAWMTIENKLVRQKPKKSTDNKSCYLIIYLLHVTSSGKLQTLTVKNQWWSKNSEVTGINQ